MCVMRVYRNVALVTCMWAWEKLARRARHQPKQLVLHQDVSTESKSLGYVVD